MDEAKEWLSNIKSMAEINNWAEKVQLSSSKEVDQQSL